MRPAIVFEDADVDAAGQGAGGAASSAMPARSASPRRGFLVQEKVYDEFVDKFIAAAKAVKVGDGLRRADTRMGPLAHMRAASTRMEGFVADAKQKGAKVKTGGNRIGNKGFFFEPTVLTDVPHGRPHHERGAVRPARHDRAVQRLRGRRQGGEPPALRARAYAFTRSAKTATAIGAAIESGMVSINHAASRCPRCRSAASRIPATAPKAAPRRSTPT